METCAKVARLYDTPVDSKTLYMQVICLTLKYPHTCLLGVVCNKQTFQEARTLQNCHEVTVTQAIRSNYVRHHTITT